MDGTISFNPLYVKVLGLDHPTALMLSQIMYWYTPGKNGKAKIQCFKDDKFWLAKSHKDWEEELGLTRFQSQRCLQLLKEKGLIETALYRFNGSPTVHLKSTLTNGNQLTNEQIQAFHCGLTSNPLPANAQFLTETTTETTTENTSGAGFALPGLAALAEGKTNSASGESASGKTNPEAFLKGAARVKTNNKEKAMATAAEILSKFTQKPVVANTKAGLYYLWQKRMAALTGEFTKELTLKDKGQLGQFLTKAGPKAGEALDFALNNWGKFTWEVRNKKNFSSAPEVPLPGYVLAHYDILLQLIAQPTAPVLVATPTTAPAAKATPKPTEPVVADKPTKEQILADLAYFTNLEKK